MSNESSWADQKRDFDDLCKLWDKAQDDGIFDVKGKNQDTRQDFFGQHDFPEEVDLTSDDSAYWDNVLRRSGELIPDESMVLMEAARKKAEKNKKKSVLAKKPAKKEAGEKEPLGQKTSSGKKLDSGATGDPGVSKPFHRVSTSLEKTDLPSIAKKAKRLAAANNPVSQTAYGDDTRDEQGRVKVTAGLAAHPLYNDIEKLKLELNVAEEKMLRMSAMAKNTESMKKTFERLQKRIDSLCRKVTGDYKDSPLRN
jgi:hypothetical protein